MSGLAAAQPSLLRVLPLPVCAFRGEKSFAMTQRPPKPPQPKGDASKPGQSTPGEAGDKADLAFDLWLKRGLHQIYDDVAREPIPEDLLRLIQEDRKK